jgi:hypothetical protein
MQGGSLYPTTKRGTKRNLSLKKLVETEKSGIGLSDGCQWTLNFQPFYGEACSANFYPLRSGVTRSSVSYGAVKRWVQYM